MPLSGIKLLDANVWLALAYSDHVHHPEAAKWFEAQHAGTCAFCRISQLALLRLLTNSKVMGDSVLSQRDAWNTFEAFRSDFRVTLVTEPESLDVDFKKFANAATPSNVTWTDAYLASLALISEYELVTFDRGLTKYPGVNVKLLSSA
jgi:uncharacterized protein